MKFLLLILTILAVSCVRADHEDCSEERAQACIDTLLTVTLGDSTEEEACRELRSSVECIKEEVDDCLGDERNSEVDDGLEKLEKLLTVKCNADDDEGDDDDDEEMADIKKCYEQNEDYIYECIYEGTQQALNLLADVDEPDVDEKFLKCVVYDRMSACYVDRVREKCGEKAATTAVEELRDMPEEIAEACEATGGIEISDVQLNGENKRK